MGDGQTGARQKDDVDGTLAPGSRWLLHGAVVCTQSR